MAAGLPVRMLQAMAIQRRWPHPDRHPTRHRPPGQAMRHPCERL